MNDPHARARTSLVIAAVIGMIVATAVIGYFNVGAVLAAIRPMGVGSFVIVMLAQLVLFVPLGFAWWLVALANPDRSPVFIWSRMMREAASDVLPFSQLGGLVIAARVAVLGGVNTGKALGSSVVDVTIEVAAQLIYTLAGIVLLALHFGLGSGHNKLLLSLAGGLTIAGVMVGGFVFTQLRGLDFIEGFVRRMAPAAAHHATAVNRAIDAAYAQPKRVWGCVALHLIGWFGGAVGAWLILTFIGRPLPFASIVAIESLLFAIRNIAFIVPSALGVQEGMYALLGPLFGLPPETALALSLLKRARDVAIGVPVLLSWQILEGRKRLRESTARASG